MTGGILSKIIAEISDLNAEAKAENYAMVNVRPGEKVAVMLDIISQLSGKSPSALLTDKISKYLAHYAASSSSNATAVLDAVKSKIEESNHHSFQENSALDYLEKAKIIEVVDPFKSELSKMFKGSISE